MMLQMKISKYKILNFDNVANEKNTEHNQNWSNIPDHPCRILIIGGCGQEKQMHCLI